MNDKTNKTNTKGGTLSVTKKKTYKWYLCKRCTNQVVNDLQDHERLIIKDPAYADGECQVCYGVISYIVIVQQNTEEWLHLFTFNRDYNIRVNGQYFLDKQKTVD